MPTVTQSDAPRSRFLAEPQRTLLTPSASPSVGPPDRPPAKRPRLRSTPSSSISATPSTSNESTTSVDVNSARRASTLRVLNTWAQLAERYSKPLDEDDIIDLHRYVIIKDRGVVEGASKEFHIGHFTQLDSDQDYPDADQDQEDSEQDDDDNELSALPPSETTTDDDAPISKKELLRGVPPLSATTDAEDLKEFLEAEKRRRELAGDEEDEEGMSAEQLSVLRKELEERLQKKEDISGTQARDVASAEPALEHEADATPTRPSARIPPLEDESEDELALWTNDESTAVYRVAREGSEQDVREVEREVIELTDSDSDEEFEAILTHPPRFSLVSPPPVPIPNEVQQPLQSPPDNNRGKSKFRSRSHLKIKTAEVPSSEDHPCSPLVPRKPEVIPTHKRKPSVSKETRKIVSDDGRSDQDVVGLTPPVLKGKGKEVLALVEDGNREKTPKPLGVVARSRKRKRIVSSTVSGTHSVESAAEPKSALQSHGKSTSQRSITPPQPSGHEQIMEKDKSTPVRFEPNIARLPCSISSASKSQAPALSDPAYGPLQPESAQLNPHGHNLNDPLLSDLSVPIPALFPVPVAHPYSQRRPSHPPPILSSPNQVIPNLPLPAHPPPTVDPMQTQQAHYLLAQAMHQLSYLLSTTMSSYAAYASNSRQSWHHIPPPAHAVYGTPIHQPPHFHGTRHYPTPSSSISGLPPSSPVRSSISPPAEEQRARNRGRSKSRGRRVSFQLDSLEVVGDREHDTQPELQHSGQKKRKPALEGKKGLGKGKATEEFSDPLRLEEDRDSPPREITRGRTPGPSSHQKINVPRGTSLSRR